MNQIFRQTTIDPFWMGFTILEMTGVLFAVLAVVLLTLSSMPDFAEIWNAS